MLGKTFVFVITYICLKHLYLSSLFSGSVPYFRESFSYNLGTSTKHLARATLVQLPLRLAWGVTCHKVQGQTFTSSSKIVTHWSKGLPAGMVYVMLSRSKTIDDISIQRAFDQRQIRCDFSAKLMVEQLENRYHAFLLKRSPVKDPSLFIVSFVNIQCMQNKIVDLLADKVLQKANLLHLCETWLEENSNIPSLLPKLVGLSHIKKGKGPSMSSYADSTIVANVINFQEFQRIETVNHNCALIHVYRSSRRHHWQFFAQLEGALTDDVAIVLGDFNLPNAGNILPLMSQYHFHQGITSDTHRGRNRLDLCFTRHFKTEAYLHPVYYSDHDSIFFNVLQRL